MLQSLFAGGLLASFITQVAALCPLHPLSSLAMQHPSSSGRLPSYKGRTQRYHPYPRYPVPPPPYEDDAYFSTIYDEVCVILDVPQREVIQVSRTALCLFTFHTKRRDNHA